MSTSSEIAELQEKNKKAATGKYKWEILTGFTVKTPDLINLM